MILSHHLKSQFKLYARKILSHHVSRFQFGNIVDRIVGKKFFSSTPKDSNNGFDLSSKQKDDEYLIKIIHNTPFGQLTLQNRENVINQIAFLLEQNINLKKKSGLFEMRSFVLPLLSQPYGAGKSTIIKEFVNQYRKVNPNSTSTLKNMFVIIVDFRTISEFSLNLNVRKKMIMLIVKTFFNLYGMNLTIPDSNNFSFETLERFIVNQGEDDDAMENEIKSWKGFNPEIFQKIKKEMLKYEAKGILLGFDEIGQMASVKNYNEMEQKFINDQIAKIQHKNMFADNLVPLYFFWEEIKSFMIYLNTEVIAIGRGFPVLMGHKLSLPSPTLVEHIILNSLKQNYIVNLMKETLKEQSEFLLMENEVNELARYIYDLTGGHALFVRVALNYLWHKNLLVEYVPNKTYFYAKMFRVLQLNSFTEMYVSSILDGLTDFSKSDGLGEFFDDAFSGEVEIRKTYKISTNRRFTGLELVNLFGLMSEQTDRYDFIAVKFPELIYSKLVTEEVFLTKIDKYPVLLGMEFELTVLSGIINKMKLNRNLTLPHLFPVLSSLNLKRCLSIYNLPKIVHSNGHTYTEHLEQNQSRKGLIRTDYSKLLRNLKEDLLYKHDPLSSSPDALLKSKSALPGQTMYVCWQIKYSTKIDFSFNKNNEINKILPDILSADPDSYLRFIFVVRVIGGESKIVNESVTIDSEGKFVYTSLDEDYVQTQHKIVCSIMINGIICEIEKLGKTKSEKME